MVENLFPSGGSGSWEGNRLPIQRVVMPVTGIESWTVVGGDGAVVAPVERYLAYLFALERSPNTVRAYATSLGLWFGFLGQAGVGRGDHAAGRHARQLFRGPRSAGEHRAGPDRRGQRLRRGRLPGRPGRRAPGLPAAADRAARRGHVDAAVAPFDAICGVSVSQFGVPADQPAVPPPSPLTARITAAATVRPGEDFTYTVTLTNRTAKAYPLRPCPAYQEYVYAITGPGTTAARADHVARNYYLNCDTVHQIRAHSAVASRAQNEPCRFWASWLC